MRIKTRIDKHGVHATLREVKVALRATARETRGLDDELADLQDGLATSIGRLLRTYEQDVDTLSLTLRT